VSNLSVRRRGQKLVHRSALIRLDVSKRDPPQPFEGQDAANGLRDERKHSARARMEQERLIRVDEELIKREHPWRRLGHAG
jgi:hypothetical protein